MNSVPVQINSIQTPLLSWRRGRPTGWIQERGAVAVGVSGMMAGAGLARAIVDAGQTALALSTIAIGNAVSRSLADAGAVATALTALAVSGTPLPRAVSDRSGASIALSNLAVWSENDAGIFPDGGSVAVGLSSLNV